MKKTKAGQDRRDEGNQGDIIKREKIVVDALLTAFKTNGVEALVIMEKEYQVAIFSNGINLGAILPFLIDLRLNHPEIFEDLENILNDLGVGLGSEDVTVH